MLLPHRIAVEVRRNGTDTDVAAYLNAALGQDVVVSLRIGPARANRKPVLELLAARRRADGFAKVGVTDLTCDLVRTEAAALAASLPCRWIAWRFPGCSITGSGVATRSWFRRRCPGPARLRNCGSAAGAMAELARCRDVTRQPVAQSPYWLALRPRLKGCAQPDLAASVLQALARWSPPPRPRAWPSARGTATGRPGT